MRKFGALTVASVLIIALRAIAQISPSTEQAFSQKLVAAAIERTHHQVRYISEYVRIPYPGGDVPDGTGVCTDEIIRAYRVLGIDLQREVHEDMVKNFSVYPHKRGWLNRPDSNIDHRRVPNLRVFFAREARLCRLPPEHRTMLPATSLPGIWVVEWITSELSSIARHCLATVTRSFTTLGKVRKWKMFYSSGRSQATIVTTALSISLFNHLAHRAFADPPC